LCLADRRRSAADGQKESSERRENENETRRDFQQTKVRLQIQHALYVISGNTVAEDIPATNIFPHRPLKSISLVKSGANPQAFARVAGL
jgi:hypothetical protein